MKMITTFIISSFFLISQVFAQVNINTASVKELTALPGIGAVKAAAIIKYRKSHGQFKSVKDLAHVGGIGPMTLKNLGRDIKISGKTDISQFTHKKPSSKSTPVRKSDHHKSTSARKSSHHKSTPVRKSSHHKSTPVRKSDHHKSTSVRKSDHHKSTPVRKSGHHKSTPVRKSDHHKSTPVRKSGHHKSTPVRKSGHHKSKQKK